MKLVETGAYKRSGFGRLNYKQIVFAAVGLVLLGGCVTQQAEYPDAPDHIPELLHGQAAFGEAVDPAPDEDLLAMSSEMHQFIEDADVNGSRIAYSRFKRLMGSLIKGGYFSNHYRADGTYAAAETFANAQGNCLGYTNMFIALARAADLKAKYQLVETSPMFDFAAGQLIRNNHINLIVEGVYLPGSYNADVVVDFNIVQPDPDYAEPTIVSDEFAEALYYVNLAVEYMHAGEWRSSFAHFKRAALTDPSNHFVWSNIGVFYSRMGKPHEAEKAYQVAISLDRNNKSAMAGMVVALKGQGRYEEALRFERRVHWYQRRNPYYHYAVADEAYRDERFEEALVAIEHAIDLRGNDARFFALRAATAAELGDARLRERSVNLAKKHAKRGNERLAPNPKVYGKLESVEG